MLQQEFVSYTSVFICSMYLCARLCIQIRYNKEDYLDGDRN